ncbi:SulP family inorganic anion transporter [Oceanomicrobium pacificus]|uniref:Cyclic nucleotide-binding domain-containing protein n=1 Tax=Oceanomicrobium pacificus TaxID=2692916 RepID=A0A6B0TMF3_9RHOB|nr:SulP family inorganic anion transporter [Oceanomicrobium pacificus]MXU65066.1 cyclic nucleotide-binding domain-containing protein [Oceanomicrobium pacificus]
MATETSQSMADRRGARLASLTGVAVLAVLSVSFAIALTSIIYVGPLSVHADRGIGLALLGGIAMPVVAALLSSYRALVFHIQDIPALLISLTVAGFAADLAPDSAFATVAVLAAGSAFLSGVALLVAGMLNLGFLARYIPYPVIGGFLAATGFLLTTGGLGMMVREPVSAFTLGHLAAPELLKLWLPWFGFALVLVWATRRFASPLVLPSLIIGGTAAFYAWLGFTGTDLNRAGDMGLLVGPFAEGGFLDGLSLSILSDADWSIIKSELPTVFAVVAMTFIGVLLNCSGLEVALGRDFDMQRELRASGVANIVGGAMGGMTSFHLLGETMLGCRMGIRGIGAALGISAAFTFVLLFGASAIGNLPIGLLAALIIMLGVDFLYEWLWVKRTKFPRGDRAIVALIVVVAATIGFLEAFFTGLFAAAILFILSYARTDVVHLVTTAAARPSSVERSVADRARLDSKAERIAIYELSGHLFFGTANSLLDRIRSDLDVAPRGGGLIVDFARVTGIDSSTGFVLDRIAALAAQRGRTVALSGMSHDLQKRFAAEIGAADGLQVYPTLDEALVAYESRLLDNTARAAIDPVALMDGLMARHPDLDIGAYTALHRLEDGEALIRAGDPSKAAFRLLSGGMRAEVEGRAGTRYVVTRFEPGALLGEMAFYADQPRTADLVASGACLLLRYDLEALNADPKAVALAREVHLEAAQLLSHRLYRMTQLARDAGL